MIERESESAVFILMPTGSDSENDPSARDILDRVDHLGEEGRVAKRCRCHHRSKLDAVGNGRQRRQDRPALSDALLVNGSSIAAIDQVVGEPD